MDNQQERLELNIHWFAGFFEGEGWFSLMKSMRDYKGEIRLVLVPVCGMCNTDFSILEDIERLLKSNGIIYQLHRRKLRKATHKKNWQLNMQGMKRSILFIEWILPYLRSEKAYKAKKMLDFCKKRKDTLSSGWCGVSYSENELKIYDEMYSKIPNDYTPNTER